MYSLTKYPEKRKRIIDTVQDDDRVLIVGTGSATYLQEELLRKKRVKIIASDLSQKMLDIAFEKFTHPRLSYVRADTRDLPFQEEFDIVLSTNSIIPETRNEVRRMCVSISGALRSNGTLAAYLPSYTCGQELRSLHPDLEFESDDSQLCENETTGAQCFHTRDSIYREFGYAGLRVAGLRRVPFIENDQEKADLEERYGSLSEATDWLKDSWEFFLTAKKR